MALDIAAQGQGAEAVMADLPLTVTQADGVMVLSAAAAGVGKWSGTQSTRQRREEAALRFENGAIVRWCGDIERPVWRVQIASGGWYRVTVTQATAPGEEHRASVEFSAAGQRTKVVTRLIEGAAAAPVSALEMGEIDLGAGEQLVTFRPLSWMTPYEQGRLADVRLIPMEPVRKWERGAGDAMKRMGVDAAPAVATLVAETQQAKTEVESLSRETRRKEYGDFTTFAQFLAFDRAPARLTEAQQTVATLTGKLQSARIAQARAMPGGLAKLPPAEKAALEEFIKAVTAVEEAQTSAYPTRSGAASAPGRAGRKTLFPTGHFEELPLQPIDEKKPRVKLVLAPPAGLEQRQAQFAARNSAEGVAALCGQLARVLVPHSPGLEEFERRHAAGQYREALEAYRDFFFAKLANPEAHGAATENLLFELTRDRGKRELLMRPSALALEENMNGAAVAEIGTQVLIGGIGMPGSVSWAPAGLRVPESAAQEGRVGRDPWWQTDAGKDAKRTLEFFRYLHSFPADRGEFYSGGFFPALLWSYALTGNPAHLRRWCEYLDDFAMNAQRDLDDAPFGSRNATELETQGTRATLNLLRIVLDERPELARNFDAATLARLLMHMVADHAPYLIRARRTEMANWGIMGLCHQLHVSRFLAEFQAEAYFNRECWRLWNANMIQHRTLDGENIEAWDDGHNYVTQEYARQSLAFARWPEGMDRWDVADLYDQLRVDQRSKLIHISPGGFYLPYQLARYPRASNTLQSYYRPDAGGGEAFNLIETEAGAQARLRTLMSGGHPVDGIFPDRFSDHAPYAAMSYLRESWRPEADYFVLQNFRTRSQGQADCSRTMYALSKNDRVLVEAHGLVVDGKPDNRYQEATRTGGKTEYCAQASREVWPDRFHTSARFDFAEALQDAPYALHRYPYADPWGLYSGRATEPDPNPITDVTVLRQCFGIRGEGLWLVCDRIQNPGSGTHEYTQFFSLPLRIDEKGFADRLRVLGAAGNPLVQVDEKGQHIRTSNPGFENVSIACFAPAPLQFANGLDAKRLPLRLPGSARERVETKISAGRLDFQSLKRPLVEPVSVRWTGKGSQIFLTALASSAAQDDPASAAATQAVEGLQEPGGVLGCRTAGPSGTICWLASGPEKQNALRAGPVQARAETLLVVQSKGRPLAGIVLGCAEFSGVRLAAAHPPDFEFELGPDGRIAQFTAIHRPIGNVRILPATDVFTEAMDVSMALPEGTARDVELRYTLDGTDPAVDSPLYRTPFRIAETTMVKVRAFRAGLHVTPWTADGVDSGRTMSAIFRRKTPKPAVMGAASASSSRGLRYQYFEGDWPTLFSYAADPVVLEPKGSGNVTTLLDAGDIERMRQTDRAFAVRYEGYLQVPKTDLYTFFAPPQLYAPLLDAGYDLRVFIDDEEWMPSPRLHAENSWSIPLQAGAHRLRVAYVDFRWRKFRNDYWLTWLPEEMGREIPAVEIQSSELRRQPLPAGWLRR